MMVVCSRGRVHEYSSYPIYVVIVRQSCIEEGEIRNPSPAHCISGHGISLARWSAHRISMKNHVWIWELGISRNGDDSSSQANEISRKTSKMSDSMRIWASRSIATTIPSIITVTITGRASWRYTVMTIMWHHTTLDSRRWSHWKISSGRCERTGISRRSDRVSSSMQKPPPSMNSGVQNVSRNERENSQNTVLSGSPTIRTSWSRSIRIRSPSPHSIRSLRLRRWMSSSSSTIGMSLMSSSMQNNLPIWRLPSRMMISRSAWIPVELSS